MTNDDLAMGAVALFFAAPVIGIALAVAIGLFFGAGWGFLAIAIEVALMTALIVRCYAKSKRKEDK